MTAAIAGMGGNDIIFGFAGNDFLDGDAGDDTIHGGAGMDTIDGGADADTLNGGGEADTITGGAGNDTITGGADDDTIDGGADMDTVVYTGANGDYAIWMVGDTTYVVHENDGTSSQGRDTLTNVEMIQFGAGPAITVAMAVAEDGSDTGTTLTNMAPTGPLAATVGMALAGVNLDVSTWFTGGGVRAYEVTGTGNGVTYDGGTKMIEGMPTAAGTITLRVTASTIDGSDHDDLTVTLVINATAASGGAVRAPGKEEIVGFSVDDDLSGAYGDTGPAAADGDDCRCCLEQDQDEAAASLSDVDDPCGCFF